MARHKRDGLLYFPFDTDFFYADKRIRALHSRFGNDGLMFYLFLLTEIYRERGYYLIWNEESEDDAISALHLTEGLIKQVMAFLVSRSLLVSILADPDTVITSPGIQKRYQEAAKSLRRDIYVEKVIWLLSNEDTEPFIKFVQKLDKSGKNENKSGKNNSKSGINRGKEIKGNKRREEEIKIYFPDSPALDETFRSFVAEREVMKAPMTENAIKLAIKKLMEIADSDEERIKIINESIMKRYKGLFPIGGKTGKAFEDAWRDA